MGNPISWPSYWYYARILSRARRVVLGAILRSNAAGLLSRLRLALIFQPRMKGNSLAMPAAAPIPNSGWWRCSPTGRSLSPR